MIPIIWAVNCILMKCGIIPVLFVRGIEGGLGIAFRPNDYISFGLSGKYKFIMAQDADSTYVDNQIITDTEFVPLGPDSTYPYTQFVNLATVKQDTKPFGALPYMIRFGIGLYPTEFQTFTADVAYYSANDANNPFTAHALFSITFGFRNYFLKN